MRYLALTRSATRVLREAIIMEMSVERKERRGLKKEKTLKLGGRALPPGPQPPHPPGREALARGGALRWGGRLNDGDSRQVVGQLWEEEVAAGSGNSGRGVPCRLWRSCSTTPRSTTPRSSTPRTRASFPVIRHARRGTKSWRGSSARTRAGMAGIGRARQRFKSTASGSSSGGKRSG